MRKGEHSQAAPSIKSEAPALSSMEGVPLFPVKASEDKNNELGTTKPDDHKSTAAQALPKELLSAFYQRAMNKYFKHRDETFLLSENTRK